MRPWTPSLKIRPHLADELRRWLEALEPSRDYTRDERLFILAMAGLRKQERDKANTRKARKAQRER